MSRQKVAPTAIQRCQPTTAAVERSFFHAEQAMYLPKTKVFFDEKC